jgi:two-component system, NtrC family, sensor kinase
MSAPAAGAPGPTLEAPTGGATVVPREEYALGNLGEDIGMRLAWKLIVALVTGLVLVLAVSGWLRVRGEVEVFEADMRRDHQEVARVLQPSLVAGYRRGGEKELLAVIDRRAQDGRLMVRWLHDPPDDRAPQDLRSHVFPVTIDGKLLGGLQISERRDQERTFVRDSMIRTGLVTLALASTASAIVMAFTFVLVGRPVRQLREKTRRIASGDLSGALALAQRDEIGDLARDIDKMCEDLADARLRAEEEGLARTRALDQLRHADRLASVGTLASGIAHELGTPLGVVLARARLIEEDQTLPRATTGSARAIADQVERMSRIIRQLLDFARSGKSLGMTTREPVDLGAIARSVVTLVQPLAHKHQVRLAVEEGAHTFARGDSGLLQQVLLNLLMNAVQAMNRPGAITVSSSTVEVTPPPGLNLPAGRYARLEVEDQGPGIPGEVLRRIFEPFFTTKEVGEGTGLGLSVVWGIVREHDGWIEVHNVPQGGARFDVYLPAALGADAAAIG